MAAHGSQILLVFGGIVGYFLTVRPINQKEKLEEEIVEARDAVERSRAEAAIVEARIADFNAKVQRLESERARLGAEVDRTRKDAERAKQDARDAKEKAEAEQVRLVSESQQLKERLAHEAAEIQASYDKQLAAAKTRAENAEQRMLSVEDEKRRMEKFNRLRAHVMSACLSPSLELFGDLADRLSCVSEIAKAHQDELALTPNDHALLDGWTARERIMIQERIGPEQRHLALGRFVVEKTYGASIPCSGSPDNSGSVIELPDASTATGKRCTSLEKFSGTIGSLVARYGALQWAVDSILSGAAEGRDASKFAAPSPPTNVTAN